MQGWTAVVKGLHHARREDWSSSKVFLNGGIVQREKMEPATRKIPLNVRHCRHLEPPG